MDQRIYLHLAINWTFSKKKFDTGCPRNCATKNSKIDFAKLHIYNHTISINGHILYREWNILMHLVDVLVFTFFHLSERKQGERLSKKEYAKIWLNKRTLQIFHE